MTPNHQTRSIELRAVVDSDEFEAVLATDFPYQRTWGLEILQCTREAVDLSRSAGGMPLLAFHDHNRLAGRVTDVRIEGGKLRGRVKFFDTTEGRDALAAVRGGHRDLSIGYVISETKRGQGDEVLVTRWTPYEASFVAIGADPTAGINRSISTSNTGKTMTDITTTENRDFDPAALSRSQQRAARRDSAAENERIAEIVTIGQQFRHYGAEAMAQQVIAEGGTEADLRQRILRSMHSTPQLSVVGAPRRGSEYSLGRAIQAQIDPAQYLRSAGDEVDQSRALASRSRLRPNGLFIPMSAIFGEMHRQVQERSMLAGTASLGGSFVQTTIEASMFADVLRAATVAVPLGARVMSGLSDTISIPRKTATTSADWLTEVASTTASDPSTDALTLSPKRIGARTIYSRQLLIQSALDLENMIRQDLATTILAELDRCALFGTGASNQPRGIASTSGIGSVVGGTNGASLTWAHVLQLESTVAAANALVDPSSCGYAINPATRAWAKRTLKVSGVSTDLMMGDDMVGADGMSRLNGYRAAVSTKLPSNGTKGTATSVCSTLIFGDFSELIIGQFDSGIDLLVDPYSYASTGQVAIHANLFCDVVVRRPSSFAVMTDALTA